MQHAVPFAVGENGIDGSGIGQVADDQAHTGVERLRVAEAKIVEHHDLMAGLGERQDRMAADIAGAACDEVATHSALL